jgi:hypothetical protein
MRATEESEPGSLAVVYSCPACGYEMAMLTNQHETDMVRSLGVRIGPAAAAAIANPGMPSGPSAGMAAMGASGAEAPAGKCPFSAMLGGTTQQGVEIPTGPAWTAGALERLEAIPEMVRPMARAGIEMVARENGQALIDEEVLAAARSRFGM